MLKNGSSGKFYVFYFFNISFTFLVFGAVLDLQQNYHIIMLSLGVHFVFTKDKSTLMPHKHPRSIVYLRVHSWCSTFCGFGQMYKDIHPLL